MVSLSLCYKKVAASYVTKKNKNQYTYIYIYTEIKNTTNRDTTRRKAKSSYFSS